MANQGIAWNKGTGHYNTPNIAQTKRGANQGLKAMGDMLKQKQPKKECDLCAA
tara:strand:+ start:290 stop:448 length:159 start_codon:yes stop_codon:yes gene_type:complete